MPTRKYWDKVNATQKAMMRNMKASRILEVQSNGDLTFEAEGRQYILTTNGELSPGTPTYHPDRPGPMPQRLPQTELTPSQKVFIQPGYGYHVEYMGNITGEFRRASKEVPVKIVELKYRGRSDDVLIELEDGRKGIATIQSLRPSTGSLPQTMPERGMDYYKVPPDAY